MGAPSFFTGHTAAEPASFFLKLPGHDKTFFFAVCGVALFSCTRAIASIMLRGLVIWQFLHLLISYVSF